MKKRQNRKVLVISLIVTIVVAIVLVTRFLNQQTPYYYTPEQFVDGETPTGGPDFYIVGLVAVGSIKYDGTKVDFDITGISADSTYAIIIKNDGTKEDYGVTGISADSTYSISVKYEGALPDSFREGECVLAKGSSTKKVFTASSVDVCVLVPGETKEPESDGSCISKAVSLCKRSCERDPKFTYCGIVFMGKVSGSGCTKEIDRLSYIDKVKKCKKMACGKVRRQARESCVD